MARRVPFGAKAMPPAARGRSRLRSRPSAKRTATWRPVAKATASPGPAATWSIHFRGRSAMRVTAPVAVRRGDEAVVAAGDEAPAVDGARGGQDRAGMDRDARLGLAGEEAHRAVAEGEGGGVAEEDGVDDEGGEGRLLDGGHESMLPLREERSCRPYRGSSLTRFYGGTYIGRRRLPSIPRSAKPR